MTDWRTLAACHSHADPDLWFSERHPARTAQAKRICQSCPVLNDCHQYAARLDAQLDNALHGVWAAKTSEDRRQARRRWRWTA